MLDIPLMSNNINSSDIAALTEFLQNSDRFTNGPKVREFEEAWSKWLGVKYSVFVNSGSSANYMTLAGIREQYGPGEVIVPPIGWASDIAAVIAAGMEPVFVDVGLKNFAMEEEGILARMTGRTKAVLLTHVLGYNGMTQRLRDICTEQGIVLIEDVCESHGAVFQGKKLGSIGDISNFSFYYAHHMSTIEGGMVCTDDEEFYNMMRMFRSHGMLRECDNKDYIKAVSGEHPELHPEFIFTVPGYNMRSTELNAVIGLSQLKRLDKNIEARRENYQLFIENLDPEIYYTDFDGVGNSNYAFVVMLREGDPDRFGRITELLRKENVEFRRGTAGGGNLLRQPFVRKRYPQIGPADFPNAEHIHQFGIYTGNYPDLTKEKILGLCEALNHVGNTK